MTQTGSKAQIFLARFTLLLVLALIVAGVALNGISAEVHQRVWQSMLNRPGQLMAFRFILQPTMAAIAALLDGIRDARTGRTPYAWTILTDGRDRGGRLWEGLIATYRIILLGLAMDTIYQLLEFRTFYPAEAVIIVFVLAFAPYLLLRGPFARIARWWFGCDESSRP